LCEPQARVAFHQRLKLPSHASHTYYLFPCLCVHRSVSSCAGPSYTPSTFGDFHFTARLFLGFQLYRPALRGFPHYSPVNGKRLLSNHRRKLNFRCRRDKKLIKRSIFKAKDWKCKTRFLISSSKTAVFFLGLF